MTARRTAKVLQRYGLEFELERVRTPHTPGGWSATNDGTLRDGGVEFVSTTPMKYAEAIEAAERLFSTLTRYEVSARCSTHLHLNAPRGEMKRLAMYAGLLTLEDELFTRFAEARKSNNYCVPGLYSPAGLCGVSTLWGGRAMSTGADAKYSATNYMALERHGTLELRHFPPLVDPDTLRAVLDTVRPVYDLVDSVPNGSAVTTLIVQLVQWGKAHPDPDAVSWVRGALQLIND